MQSPETKSNTTDEHEQEHSHEYRTVEEKKEIICKHIRLPLTISIAVFSPCIASQLAIESAALDKTKNEVMAIEMWQ